MNNIEGLLSICYHYVLLKFSMIHVRIFTLILDSVNYEYSGVSNYSYYLLLF